MIVDLRTYTLGPGRMADYLQLYLAEGFPTHVRHVGRPIGYFRSEVGELNQVVHLWGYASMAEREERRAVLEADPAWMAYRRRMWQAGTVQRQENRLLRSVDLPEV